MKAAKFLRMTFSLLALIIIKESVANDYEIEVKKSKYKDLVNPAIITNYWQENEAFTLGFFSNELLKIYDRTFVIDGQKAILLGVIGYIAGVNNNYGFIIDGFFANIIPKENEQSEISMEAIGNPGDYVIKFQWKNVGLKGHFENDYLNFQIWLFQKTGKIEIHIGPSQITSNLAFNKFNGPKTGVMLSNSNFSEIYQSSYLSQDPEKPEKESFTNLITLNGTPSDSTVYIFNPINNSLNTNNSLSNLSLYPNPANNILKTGNIFNMKYVKIHSIDGKLVYEMHSSNQGEIPNTIDISKLETGPYIIEIESETGRYKSKFIKL